MPEPSAARPLDVPQHSSALPDAVIGDASDEVAEARVQARAVLGAEPHPGAIDDWRHVLVSGQDATIVLGTVWAALEGVGRTDLAPVLLIPVSVGVALLIGLSAGRATLISVQYHARMLDDERAKLRDDVTREHADLQAIYAAKGFQEPLLTQIVSTLSADDDRLLKVMMEEKLGLSMHHMHHPILVALANGGAAMGCGLMLSLPAILWGGGHARWWILTAGMAVLAVLAAWSAAVLRRSATSLAAASTATAIASCGTAYFLARWLSELVALGTSR